MIPSLQRRLLSCSIVFVFLAGCPTGPGQFVERCSSDFDCLAGDRCVDGTCEASGRLEPETQTPAVNDPEPIEPEAVEPSVAPDVVEPEGVEPDGAAEPDPPTDGGEPSPPVDGGEPEVNPDDAGPGPTDGGAQPLDAGPRPFDGGAPVDAGEPDVGPQDAGAPDAGPIDGGAVVPTDAFDTPWFDPVYDVRARYRIANGRFPTYEGFPFFVRIEPEHMGLSSLPTDEDAYQVTTDDGTVLPFHFEQPRSTGINLWVNLDVEGGANRQVVFVYLRTAGAIAPRPALPLYGPRVVSAFHLSDLSTVLVDSAGGPSGVGATGSPSAGRIAGGRSLEEGRLEFPNTPLHHPSITGNRNGSFSFWIKPVLPAARTLLFGNPADPAGNAISVFLTSTRIVIEASDETGVIASIDFAIGQGYWTRVQVAWDSSSLLATNSIFSSYAEPLPAAWPGPVDQAVVFHPIADVFVDEFQVHAAVRDINWSTASRLAGSGIYSIFEDAPVPPLRAEAVNSETSPPTAPILRYTLDETSGDTLHDSSGVIPPLDLERRYGAFSWQQGRLHLEKSTLFEATGDVSRLRDAVLASNEVSVEVWARPEHPFMDGPARLLTLSGGTSRRSLTFGQDAQSWVLRLRTSETSENGSSNGALPHPIGEGEVDIDLTEMNHIVVTRDEDGIATVYLNGVVADQVPWPGTFETWDIADRLGIGNEIDSATRAWTGELSSVSLYDRALSQAEVVESFDNGSP